MTYYQKQVIALTTELYSNMYLVKQVIQAKHFIDTHFTDNITLDDICREALISRFHLIRSFKKLYGKTPYQYLTSIRISRAKALLKTDSSVTEICYAVGFGSATSFTGLFKKHVGLSPQSFKQKKQF
jgi:AraC-like DNA-binding protein